MADAIAIVSPAVIAEDAKPAPQRNPARLSRSLRAVGK
jgi:hypothetical protein